MCRIEGDLTDKMKIQEASLVTLGSHLSRKEKIILWSLKNSWMLT